MNTRRISFFSSNRPLEGTLVLPERTPAAAAVLCHGFGSYDDDIGAFVRLAERLSAAGIASLRFGFSGSDPYADRGTIRPASHWVFDCLAAVSRLRQEEGIDAARIGLLGMSVGGGVVVQAAALGAAVRCVVALAPVADGAAWLRHRWLATRSQERWNQFVAEVEADHAAVVRGRPSRVVQHFDVQAFPDEQAWNEVLAQYPRLLREMTLQSVWDTLLFQPRFYANAVTEPLRIIHGDADESVPLSQGEELFQRAGHSADLIVLPGAPHCCWGTPWEDEVLRHSVEWLQRWLNWRPAGAGSRG